MLTPVELFWLTWHSENGEALVARRARALLSAHEGQSADQISAAVRLGRGAVDGLLAEFSARGLGLFPAPALFVEQLLEAARVDLAHARQVADFAVQLFDATRTLHKLPNRWREMTETAALLHNVALGVDEARHHIAGRDLLMAMRLVPYTTVEQRVLACSIRFHRKRARPDKEPLFTALPAPLQARTLALAALVRIADGLDYSQSQTTRLDAVRLADDSITLTVSGPNAELDGERAIVKADLWRDALGQAWQIAVPPPDYAALAQLPLAPEAPMAHVAVRAVADQCLRWRAAEPAARAGDPLGLKNVRAAARRARAALEMWRPDFKNKALKPLRKRLKQAEEALGAARDWDVLIAAVQSVAGTEEWPVLQAWQRERAVALRAALAWLDSAEAEALHADLAAFLAEPPRRRKATRTIGEAAAEALMTTLQPLRKYGEALDPGDLTTYHDLRRVAVKRCRFALEFLTPAFGSRAQRLLRAIIKVQDRLGALNDACVLRERLAPLLRADPEAPSLQALAAYCDAETQNEMRKFGRDWEAIQPARLEAQFASLVEGLRPAALEIPTDGPPDAGPAVTR